jgi:two-component system cell cycle response regulator DivK
MSRILMIDEASLFKTLEASFLRRRACTIVPAGCGRDLVERARVDRPDLILLDGDRPGLDTPACLRLLKEDPALKSIPVVVVASLERLAPCREAGADATIGRPLPPGEAEAAFCDLAAIGRRRETRRPAALRVHLEGPTGLLRARVKNISRSGLFLALRDAPPVDARVSFHLRLPGGPGMRSVRARGIVIRSVPDDPDSHRIPGAGIRFVDLGDDDRRAIERYVEGAGGPPASAEGRGRA